MELFIEQFLEAVVLSDDREHPVDRMITAFVVSTLLASATPEPPEKDRALLPPRACRRSRRQLPVC